MVLIRAIFWGMFVWGLITLTLPTAVMYYLLMTLGTFALIGLCIGLVAWLFDWLEQHFEIYDD